MVNEKPAKPTGATVEQSARKAKELLGERKSARIKAKVARVPTTPQTKGRKPRNGSGSGGKAKGKGKAAAVAEDAANTDANATTTEATTNGGDDTGGANTDTATAAAAAASPSSARRGTKKRSKPAVTETESTATLETATTAAVPSDASSAATAATTQAAPKRQRTKGRGKTAAAPKRRVSAETAALAAQAVAASAASAVSSDAKGGDAAAAAAAEKYDVVLCDIEGTTTPISFVKAILFPYIEQHLEPYLSTHWNEPETAADVRALQQLAADDIAAGTRGAVAIPSGGDAKREDVVHGVVANVRWQMLENRKSTALKQLQGHMWRAAYESGSVKGQLFADVKPNFDVWTKRGLRVAIYSSGSIEAQRLLFRYTDCTDNGGDLSGVLGGRHFDTTTGPKVEAASYVAIAKALGVPPQRVLFLTDLYAEAQAATAAGCGVCVMLRPENAPLPAAHGFTTAKDFHEVDALTR